MKCEIDTDKSIFFKYDRALLIIRMFYGFIGIAIFAISIAIIVLAPADSVSNKRFGYFIVAYLSLLLPLILSSVRNNYRALRLHTEPLHLSPNGITFSLFYQGTIRWGDISAIASLNPTKKPQEITFFLKSLKSSKDRNTWQSIFQRFFKGIGGEQFVLPVEFFHQKEIRIADAIDAYAKKYGDKGLVNKSTGKVFSMIPMGFRWFWKSASVPKWKKIIAGLFIASMVSLVIFSVPGFMNSSNAFASENYLQESKWIFGILMVVSIIFVGCFLFWMRFLWYHWILLFPISAFVVTLWIWLLLETGVPHTLDMVSKEKNVATKVFEIVDTRTDFKRCPSNAISVESDTLSGKIICVPSHIRLRARKGDEITLIGEESYWAFRFNRFILRD